MRVLVVLALVLAFVAAVAAGEDYSKRPNYVHHSALKSVETQQSMWSAWKIRHNRDYATPAEDAARFSVFQQSLHRVVAKNDALKARGLGPNYGMNRFSDLEPKEWASMYLSKDVSSARKAALLANAPIAHPTKRVDAMPSDLDYRETNPVGVTYVKDQGQCGSCWAFSVVETVESRYALKNNNTDTVLSPQQIVDCDWGDGNQGCNGGDPAVAYEYVIKNGLMTDEQYPYFSGDSGDNGTCAYVKAQVAATISAFTYATPPCSTGACSSQNDVLLAQNLASHGPTGIIVDASNWQDYTWGSFSDCSSAAADMDHGVQLAGYGGYQTTWDELGRPVGLVDMWLVRNSWNTDWGDDGYITLAGSSVGNNMCGVSNEAIFVDV